MTVGVVIASFRRTDLFGGSGSVLVHDLLGEAPAEPFTAVLFCELDPGGSVGDHRQDAFPEIVVGLEGDGEATVDGATCPLVGGSVVHLPLGSTLAITNRSPDQPLRYLIVKARTA